MFGTEFNACNCMRERHVSIRNQLRERVRSKFVRSSASQFPFDTPSFRRARTGKADYLQCTIRTIICFCGRGERVKE